MKTLRCSEKLREKLTSTHWVRIVCVIVEVEGYTTCQHAFIYNAGPMYEHSVAGHDHPVGWNNDDITRHKIG